MASEVYNFPRSRDLDKRALIMVVERNPAVQNLERFLLEQAGYSVEFAKDGRVAFQRAKELRPRILITEIMVPGMDGLSLCRALKTDPQTREIIVLVCSHLHAEDRVREAGGDAFLLKPVEEEPLIDTVAKLLAVRREKTGG